MFSFPIFAVYVAIRNVLKGILVGYSNEQKAYLVLVNKVVLKARSVYFNETEFQMKSNSEQQGEDFSNEQAIKSFHKTIDDILLEEFANDMDEVGIETSGREVEGQGSDSELETDEDTEEELPPPSCCRYCRGRSDC